MFETRLQEIRPLEKIQKNCYGGCYWIRLEIKELISNMGLLVGAQILVSLLNHLFFLTKFRVVFQMFDPPR